MSYLDYLKEANVDKAIADIAQMTQDNDHSGARIASAKLLKDKNLLKSYEAIDVISRNLGHTPNNLFLVRGDLDKKMKIIAKKKLGKDFDKFWSSL